MHGVVVVKMAQRHATSYNRAGQNLVDGRIMNDRIARILRALKDARVMLADASLADVRPIVENAIVNYTDELASLGYSLADEDVVVLAEAA